MGDNNNVISNIQITSDVISDIAATAALNVKGVAGLETSDDRSLFDFFLKKKNINGVEVRQQENGVTLSMKVVAYFGCKLGKLGAEVQKSVKEAVESMAGTKVIKADINIVGIEKAPDETSVDTEPETISN